MREIKFRAWDKMENRLVNVLELILNSAGQVQEIGVRMGYEIGNRLTFILRGNFELMQYIGLKDRKGKEIYEGDILEFADVDIKGNDLINIASVHFRKGRYEFKHAKTLESRYINNSNHDELFYIFNHSKILGNIYENRELLTQQNEGDDIKE